MDIVGGKNLGHLWDNLAATYGDKTALLFEDACGKTVEYSYAGLNREINRAANLFLDMGVEKGDRVAVQLNNIPEFIIIWFGLAKIGAIMVPINVHYLHGECAHILKKCTPRVLVIEEAFRKTHEEIQREQGLSIEHTLVVRTGGEDGVSPDEDFNERLSGQSAVLDRLVPVDSGDPAEIIFTSGTTSAPKGAVITHYNLCFAGRYTAWQVAIREDDRYMTMMPSCHIDFQCTAAMPTFISGATFILLEKYSASKFWSQACLHRATLTECIPFMIRTLLLQPEQVWEKNHCLRDVLFYLTLSDEEMEAFIKRFNVRIFTSYGMTETVVGIIGDRPGDQRKWPSIGRTGLCYDVRIQDDSGQEVPAGTLGEIAIKGVPGKTLFLEYYNDPEATEKAFRDGWLLTGDKAYVDENGYFYFVDRQLNLIKRSGENIASTEIENLLVGHPQIVDAAVIGIPDAITDEAVKAYVIVKEGECLSPGDITDYCSARIARFKVPAQVEIRESFPRTCTGKVQKNELRNECLAQCGRAPTSE